MVLVNTSILYDLCSIFDHKLWSIKNWDVYYSLKLSIVTA